MADKPVFVGTPAHWEQEITNTTAAADFVTVGASVTAWIGNMSIVNTHSASVAVQLIAHDGSSASRVIWEKTLAASGSSGYIAMPLVEMYGTSPEKQHKIVVNPAKLQIRTTTAVAGAVGASANGGTY